MIVLPGGRGDTKQYAGREFEEGYQPKGPICMACGREGDDTIDFRSGLPRNPVMVTVRPSWSPFGQHDHRQVDARCADCRNQRRG